MKRRQFTRLAAVAAPSLAAGFAAPARAQIKDIRMIESGGKSGESIEVGYIKPFTAATGVNCVRESPNQFGKLQAMVTSGKIIAATFELGSGGLEQAKALGLIEPLDWSAIDPKPMYPEAKNDYGLGYQYFSTVMAWRKGAKAPASWANFFNTKDFPGKRVLPDYPQYTLAFVLLGEGVPADKLFPLDVDRAIAKLLSIKKDISVLWKAGAQPVQLLKDNEVQYGIAWSGRTTGEPLIEFTFDQGMLDISYFCVPKGTPAPEKALAMKLLHEMTVPENQARAAEVISYTGCSPQLDALLPKDKINEFSTAAVNKAKQWLQNPQYWFANGEAVNKKWEEFKLNL